MDARNENHLFHSHLFSFCRSRRNFRSTFSIDRDNIASEIKMSRAGSVSPF
jgi:hypothetical protein